MGQENELVSQAAYQEEDADGVWDCYPQPSGAVKRVMVTPSAARVAADKAVENAATQALADELATRSLEQSVCQERDRQAAMRLYMTGQITKTQLETYLGEVYDTTVSISAPGS